MKLEIKRVPLQMTANETQNIIRNRFENLYSKLIFFIFRAGEETRAMEQSGTTAWQILLLLLGMSA